VRKTRSRVMTATAGMASLALLVAACGSDDGGDSSSAAGDGAGESSDEAVTLTVATFNEFGYEDLVTEYMELNPNVTVELRKAATSNEARDNLNTRLAAGSGLADIEAIEVDWLPELTQYDGVFVDLSDPELEGRWLDWKEAQATTEDGQLVGYGTDIGPEAVCYRSDLFEAAGLPTERDEVAELLGSTWDDYFAVGEEFIANSDVAWFDSAGAIYQGMINQVENAYEETDGTPIPLAENTVARGVYDDVMAASVGQGLSANLAQWSEDWTNAFQTDGFATMLCPAWMLGVIEGNAAGVEGWDIADTFPGGGGNWGGSFLTVPTQGENIEEAQRLAAWLTAPEQQIKAFVAKGTFPSQVEALDDPELLELTREFFNDAPAGQIMATRAEAVEVVPFKGPNYFAIQQLVSDAINRVDVDGTDDADSSWAKAENAFDELGLS
jgi:cellobiose transport system substrate-binding protein